MINDMMIEKETAVDIAIRSDPSRIHSTGCYSIDKLMNGGFYPGEIVELVGESFGKTQICYTLLAHLLLREIPNNPVFIYLDSNGSFRSTKLLEILHSLCKSSEIPSGKKLNELMSRILVKRVFNADDLFQSLCQIEQICENRNVLLVIIDNIGGCLAGTALNLKDEGHEKQSKIARKMHSLVKEYSFSLILVNYLVYWTGQPSPSLGQFWANVTQSRLLVSKNDDNSAHLSLVLCKRRGIRTLLNERTFGAVFQLSNKGVTDLVDFDAQS